MNSTVTRIRTPDGPAPVVDGPRAALRNAIAERDNAKARVKCAVAALERARELLDASEATLAGFADVDDAITAHRATGIKRWASSGGDEPTMEVPAKLIKQRRARDEAQEHVSAARAAHRTLTGELEAAKGSLQQLERCVSDAAITIMKRDAEAIAKQLEEAHALARLLGDRLQGLGYFWPPVAGERPRAFPLSASAVRVLQSDPHSLLHRLPNTHEGELIRWRVYYDKLLIDPEATFGGVVAI